MMRYLQMRGVDLFDDQSCDSLSKSGNKFREEIGNILLSARETRSRDNLYMKVDGAISIAIQRRKMF